MHMLHATHSGTQCCLDNGSGCGLVARPLPAIGKLHGAQADTGNFQLCAGERNELHLLRCRCAAPAARGHNCARCAAATDTAARARAARGARGGGGGGAPRGTADQSMEQSATRP
jgi:hypothetical protein